MIQFDEHSHTLRRLVLGLGSGLPSGQIWGSGLPSGKISGSGLSGFISAQKQCRSELSCAIQSMNVHKHIQKLK